MTNKEREMMVALIRRAKQALVITIDDDGCAGIYEFKPEFAQAVIGMFKMHPDLLDAMKYCIEVIEKERVLN